MPNPIPLNCGSNAGTGFLVTDGHSDWLVTCAHLITGEIKSTPSISHLRYAQIKVVGKPLQIPLYDGDHQRFLAASLTGSESLLDVISVKLSASEGKSLDQYGKYDIDSIVSAKVGSSVSASGFPGLKDVLVPTKKIKAKVAQVHGISVKLTKPSVVGISGAALVSSKGLIGIVHGDIGIDPHLTNALAIELNDIKHIVFK